MNGFDLPGEIHNQKTSMYWELQMNRSYNYRFLYGLPLLPAEDSGKGGGFMSIIVLQYFVQVERK